MKHDQLTEGFLVSLKDRGLSTIYMISRVGKSAIILTDVRSGDKQELSVPDAIRLLECGDMYYIRQKFERCNTTYEELNDSEKREVNRRLRYVRELINHGIRKVTERSAKEKIDLFAKEIGEKPPHWQSVRAWVKAYVDSGEKLKGLFPNHTAKGNREPRLCSILDQIIEREAKRFFHQRRSSMASIVRNVEARVIEHNINNAGKEVKVPAYNTIKAKLTAKNYSESKRARYGKRSLRTELLSVNSGIETTYALERVEIDHTQLDIKLLHDQTFALLGRPHITVLIDHFTKMVLGFQLSFEVPSFASVSSACMNSFLKKDGLLYEMGIDTCWPAHGVPKAIVADNGAEFWSGNFEIACGELGSILQYCPIRSGHYKSTIERFFGSLNSYVLDDLPGVVRKPGKAGENYDSSKDAKITFNEFKSYLCRWIVEIYHRLPVEKTGMTPLEMWQQSEDMFPVPEEDEFEIAPTLLASAERKHNRGGINTNGQIYNSPILEDLYRRDGPRYRKFKYSRYDIGWIYVLDDVNNAYLKIESDDPAYASGVSIYEDRLIRKKAAETTRMKLESEDLKKAKVLMVNQRQDLHDRNIKRKNQVSMARSARVEKIGVASQLPKLGGSSEPIEVTVNAKSVDLAGWGVE